jgi:hypothetical protein
LENVVESAARTAAVFSWADRDGVRHRWEHALRLRDGLIVDMQDYGDPEKALRSIARGQGT